MVCFVVSEFLTSAQSLCHSSASCLKIALVWHILGRTRKSTWRCLCLCNIWLDSLQYCWLYESLNILYVWLENTYSCDKYWIFWDIWPLKSAKHQCDPTGHIFAWKHVIWLTYRLSKLVKGLLRYSNLSFFEDCSHSPSWICGAQFWMRYEEHMEVFIIM